MKQSVSGLRSNNSCLLPSANDPACQNLSQSFQSSVSTKKFHEKSDQIWSFTWHQEEHWLSGMNVNYYSLTRFPHRQSHFIFPSYCEGWAAPSAIPSRLFLKRVTSETQVKNSMNSTTQELSELTKTTAASLHSMESNIVQLLNPAKWRYCISKHTLQWNWTSKAKQSLWAEKKLGKTSGRQWRRKQTPRQENPRCKGWWTLFGKRTVNTNWFVNSKSLVMFVFWMQI